MPGEVGNRPPPLGDVSGFPLPARRSRQATTAARRRVEFSAACPATPTTGRRRSATCRVFRSLPGKVDNQPPPLGECRVFRSMPGKVGNQPPPLGDESG
jgi:hypothetical protein